MAHVRPHITQFYPWNHVVALALERFEAAVARGESPRLIIEEGPRVGKSEMVSRVFAAWVLGRHPDWYAALVSYGDELAWDLSSDTRAVVMDEPFQEVFGPSYALDPVELDPNGKAVTHWKLKNHRGGLRATGINGVLTGRGINVLLFDDPVKGRREADSQSYRDDQWSQFKGTLYPRLEPGGGIIIIMQRWHKDDLVGRLLAESQASAEADQWEVITIPAQLEGGRNLTPDLYRPSGWLDCRFEDHQWAAIKANSSPREWAAKYQQRPLAEEGQIFHPYDTFLFAPPPLDEDGHPLILRRFGFADTSHAKNRESDFSAIGIFQLEPDHTLGILDFFHGRVQYPTLKQVARDLYRQWALSAFVIEDYSSGTALIQEMAREAGMRVHPYRPDRDKFARAHAAAGTLADYRVRVPTGDRFPSGCLISTVLDEINDFGPGGAPHDDITDVFTMAIINLCTRGVVRGLHTAGFTVTP